MNKWIFDRVSVSTALIVVVTALAVTVSMVYANNPLGGDAISIWVLLVALAFIKARWIILDFMELRHGNFKLRLAFEAWVLISAGSIIALAM